jgi:chemotaxis protein methyltransferase CheR
MAEETCVAFLQWALPRLGLAWPGFRRVRRQVCHRIGQRVQSLRLPGLTAYRDYLAEHPDEWAALDAFCRIPISRFLRDRSVFEHLAGSVLPELAGAALAREADEVRCWSAGCASGEEPYSLSLLWQFRLASRFPRLALRIIATDADGELLERARLGRYGRSSLRELPEPWIEAAFTRAGTRFDLRPHYQAGVEFRLEDIRQTIPAGPFDLILCRNLILTYFEDAVRRATLARILEVLRPEGALVIGLKERLPDPAPGLTAWAGDLGIYRKSGPSPAPSGGGSVLASPVIAGEPKCS